MSIISRIRKAANRVIFDKIDHLRFKISSKVNTNIFLYPHPNCKNDNYNIINYHSDNVLCLAHYILSNRKNKFNLYIIHYCKEEEQLYYNYCRQLNDNINIKFIYYKDKWLISKYSSTCKYIFTATGHTFMKHKQKSQKMVCLNYFVPFKNDYIYDSNARMSRQKINNLFDYFLMTADLPARISALDKGVPLDRLLTLGFCRNDVFHNPPMPIKEELSVKLGMKIDKLILYTPTYRDYEERNSSVIDRDMFGYDDTEYDRLNDILEENNAILIAKLHPKQQKVNLHQGGKNRIFQYNDLHIASSLYPILSVTDILITDYTSTYFDFLHCDRPVIFNFYDFDTYDRDRGFALNPIEFFCAGNIVYDSSSLIQAIEENLTGEDKHKSARQSLRPLFDKYYDDCNTERIFTYFLNQQ